MHIGIVRDAYTRGNVIHEIVYNRYDLILEFKEDKRGWQVVVVACDSKGNPLDEGYRTHGTDPRLGSQRIVLRGVDTASYWASNPKPFDPIYRGK